MTLRSSTLDYNIWMNHNFINLQQVTIHCGHKIILDAANATIGAGQTVVITGINGAGKSTFLKLLCGLKSSESGELLINNYSWHDPNMAQQLRNMIGYAPDTPPIYPNDTVYGYLNFIARLKQIPMADINVRIEEIMLLFELSPMRNCYINQLSKGLQQRLNLAQALLHKPKILILDEPTNGLDEKQCANFITHLQVLRQQQVTIVFASHIYSDLIAICDYMLKIHAGKLQQMILPIKLNQVKHEHHQIDYTT